MLSKLQLRPDNYSAANSMFNKGVDTFTGAMNTYAARLKDRAINKLLGEFTPDQSDIVGSQAELTRQLSTVQGISPVEALGLADKALSPVRAKMSYDKGMYGFTTDDMGNAYQYNKNTGDYTQVAQGPGGVPPKYIQIVPVTNRDANGVETTTYTPVDKRTGKPVQDMPLTEATDEQVLKAANYLKTHYGIETAEQLDQYPEDVKERIIEEARKAAYATSTEPVKATKLPKATNQTLDGANALAASMSLIDSIKPPSQSMAGPIDSRIDDVMAWLNVDTKDAVAAKDFDAEVANLATAFGTAQVKGVLSDKDMAFIESQLPDRRMSPEVNRNRIDSIKRKLREAIDRFNAAHPYHKVDLPQRQTNPQQPMKEAPDDEYTVIKF